MGVRGRKIRRNTIQVGSEIRLNKGNMFKCNHCGFLTGKHSIECGVCGNYIQQDNTGEEE